MHMGERNREPLGGREAEGFGEWLAASTREVTETYGTLMDSVPADNPVRYLARSAHQDFTQWLHLWKLLELGTSPYVEPELARGDFEARLIDDVIVSLQVIGRGSGTDGQPMVDVVGRYERAVVRLAKYTGADPNSVRACGENRDRLMALGEGR
jgi:hypothetical protein